MARGKEAPALYGHEGQPPVYTLKDGRELPAGELVAAACERYGRANPGLDATQVPIAWNNLDDARRRDWCQDTLDQVNDRLEMSGKAADQATVTESVVPLAARKLGAALIDAALSEVKAQVKPWQAMTEDQQSEVLERITAQVKDAVGDTIRLLATQGNVHLVCELEQVTVKKGAKLVLTCPAAELSQDLFDSVGHAVVLVIGGDLEAHGGISQPEPDPDQPDLLANAHLGNGDSGLVQHSDPED